jgi:hypothetical protein
MVRVFMLFGCSFATGATGEDAANADFLGDGGDFFINLGLVFRDHGLLGGDFRQEGVKERVIGSPGLAAGGAGKGQRGKKRRRGQRSAKNGLGLHEMNESEIGAAAPIKNNFEEWSAGCLLIFA